MTDIYDAIIVGGGHNGLVCAAYLGRAGRRVLVVEAAAGLGGCAVSAEFAPGFTVSAGAHILHLLHPKVARDLGLGLSELVRMFELNAGNTRHDRIHDIRRIETPPEPDFDQRTIDGSFCE